MILNLHCVVAVSVSDPDQGAGAGAVPDEPHLSCGVDLLQQRQALRLPSGRHPAPARDGALQLLQVRLGPAQPGAQQAHEQPGDWHATTNQSLALPWRHGLSSV